MKTQKHIERQEYERRHRQRDHYLELAQFHARNGMFSVADHYVALAKIELPPTRSQHNSILAIVRNSKFGSRTRKIVPTSHLQIE